MKKRTVLWFVLLVALGLMYVWHEANRPAPVDWTETFSPEDKIPYGTYVVYHSLPELFPEAVVSMPRVSMTELLEMPEMQDGGIYMFVGHDFLLTEQEGGRLLQWVERGNDLFVAAGNFADTLLDVCALRERIAYKRDTSVLLAGGDTCRRFFPEANYTFFQPDSLFQGQVLGFRDAPVCPDFVVVPYGKGQVWLHANPYAFSNYAALDSVNGDYWFKALSWLPEDKPMVLWDAYASMGREGEQSLLRVLLYYPALRVAWWLVLAVAVFYVLFRAKRRQRPILVVRPPENGMLEFVRTVSQLYFKQKEHAVIARKQIEFFLGEVRAVWHLPTDRLGGNFARLLAETAGVEEERANELVRLMETVRETPKVTEFTLRRLMELTDVFVRKMIDN